MEAIEHIAQQCGLTYLAMDSSITAERFYLRLGYKVVGRGEHTLRGGVSMSCTMMRKDFLFTALAPLEADLLNVSEGSSLCGRLHPFAATSVNDTAVC